jgi:FKBP-type peptidyl-prolyl cis-trans isomerase
VIKGWDIGVMQMSVGEKAQLRVSADYGYGKNGQGDIPANAELFFEVELLSIEGANAGEDED